MKTYVKTVKPGEPGFWDSKKPILGTLILELTERCNNDCVHCYINKPPNDADSLKNELALTDIRRILDEAASLGCLTVRFTGGEPLLRRDFEEIYLHARKLGMSVEIFTNATLVTERLADLFVRVPPREKIYVSLYGMTKETYESVSRKPGSFTAAMRGIERLRKRKIDLEIRTAALPQNRHELEEMETWAVSRLGSRGLAGRVILLDLHGRRDPVRSKEIQSLRLSPEVNLQAVEKKEDDYIRGVRDFFRRGVKPPGDLLFRCGAGVRRASVDANGRLQMCTRLRHPDTVYDLRRGSLKEALTRFFPQIRRRRSHNPEYLNRCGRCFLKGFCDHCPAVSWSARGTLDGIDEYFCETAHTEARFAGLLHDNEKAWEVRDWKKRIESFLRGSSGPGEGKPDRNQICKDEQ